MSWSWPLVALALVGADPVVTEAKRDPNGVLVHTVESSLQDAPTKIRVLLPDRIDKERRYRVLYVLPVEAGDGNRYGDGLDEVRKLDVANKQSVICVLPTFARLPWYADHPTDGRVRQESYFRDEVVPFIDRTYPTLAKPEGRLLLGFSKSGWGAFTLLLRHPNLFGRAAAWDAPMMMENADRFGMKEIVVTQENFEKYRVVKLLETAALGTTTRIALHGYGSFRTDHQKLDEAMERLKVPHENRDGPARKHDWHSGWVADAVAFLTADR